MHIWIWFIHNSYKQLRSCMIYSNMCIFFAFREVAEDSTVCSWLLSYRCWFHLLCLTLNLPLKTLKGTSATSLRLAASYGASPAVTSPYGRTGCHWNVWETEKFCLTQFHSCIFHSLIQRFRIPATMLCMDFRPVSDTVLQCNLIQVNELSLQESVQRR